MGDVGLPERDIITVAVLDLAPELPLYPERAQAYLRDVLNSGARPDVLMIQGVRTDDVGVLGMLHRFGEFHMSDNPSRFNYRNVTVVSDRLGKVSKRNYRVLSDMNDQHSRELVPDILIDEVEFNERPILFYNMENISGKFFEATRTYIASIPAADMYRRTKDRKRSPDYEYYKNGLAVLAGNMHADPDSESIRYLTGLQSKANYPQTYWVDVWGELRVDEGATERKNDVNDARVVVPKMLRPKRHTYMMLYGDVLGREGTPLSIGMNGNKSMSNGVPYSSTFGLTMRFYAPDHTPFVNL